MGWRERGSRLVAAVRSDEDKFAQACHYGDDDVRRAVVHTRQDVVLLVSYLSSLNSALRGIQLLLAALLALIAYGMFR